MLLLFIPLLALTLSAFAFLWAHSLAEQDRIALRYRLQVCAISGASARRDLLHNVVAINHSMKPLQYAVYLSRGIMVLPGAGVAAQISEKAALAALNTLRLARESLITLRASREALMLRCKPSAYSKSFAWCRWTLPSRAAFQDNPAAFPDVPKTVRLAPSARSPVFTCSGLQRGRLFHESVALLGDGALLSRNFRHVYETRK